MTASLETEAAKQKAALAIDTIYRIRTAQRETGKSKGHFPCPRCHTGTFHWAIAPDNGYSGTCRDPNCFHLSGH